MVFQIVAYTSIAIVAFLLFLILFEPPLDYLAYPIDCDLSSEQFLCLLGAVGDAQVHGRSRIDVFTGGDQFYEAMLETIRSAKKSVHLEAFIFHPSGIGDRFLEAMTERARAGVKVRMVVDWVGSFPAPNRYFKSLRQAGGLVKQYQPLRWYTFKRVNNRTHREILVVDGETGFIGGAGIASHWTDGEKGRPPWRDMMCRVRGDLVIGLQTCFAENWLETSGEILDMLREFPGCDKDRVAVVNSADTTPEAPARGMVVISTPSAARSTRARVLFQVLLASAKKTIHLNSPYFVPDRSAQRQLIEAVRDRGVQVVVITPGPANNHYLTRVTSRRLYGHLLKAGVEIHEYQPGMIHKKCLVVDGVWGVVGSTNFDHRSFGLNDEVNLAALDPQFSRQLEEDFAEEISQSRRITLEEWNRRPIMERVLSLIGLFMRRQE